MASQRSSVARLRPLVAASFWVRMRRWVGGLVVLCALAGCAAGAAVVPEPTPTRSAPVTAPTGGQLLIDYGLKYAPSEFSVPSALNPTIKIDQENVVTLGLTPADGMAVYTYLSENLAGMGFEVTGRSPDSLVFHNAQWEGALTVAEVSAALTLRRIS